MPLMLRGTSDLIDVYSKDYGKFQQQNYKWFQIVFFIVGDGIPLFFQLTSLVFGYIRHKKDQKK